jgi:hypothetical protein
MTTPSKASGENHLSIGDSGPPIHQVIAAIEAATDELVEGIDWVGRGERVIAGETIERLGLHQAIRDAFFCSFCGTKLVGSEMTLARYRTTAGREGSYCGKCEPESYEFPNREQMEAVVTAKTEPAFDAHIHVGDVVEFVSADPHVMRMVDPADAVSVGFRGLVRAVSNAPSSSSVAFDGKKLAAGRFRVLQRHDAVPEFDSDIRVGDVVEVVDVSTEDLGDGARFHTSRKLVGFTGKVLRYDAFAHAGWQRVRFTCGECAFGRFRVIEREGKAYERSEDKALGVPLDADDPVDGDYLTDLARGTIRMLPTLTPSHLDTLGTAWDRPRLEGEPDAVYRGRVETRIRSVYEERATKTKTDELAEQICERVMQRSMGSFAKAMRDQDNRHYRPAGTVGLDRSIAKVRDECNKHTYAVAGGPGAGGPIGPPLAAVAQQAADGFKQARREADKFAVSVSAAVERLGARTCAWCRNPITEDMRAVSFSDGAETHRLCHRYYAALVERLATGGAHDCPEERESVRRFVDAQKPSGARCRCCGAQLSTAGGLAGSSWCGDCTGNTRGVCFNNNTRKPALDQRIAAAQSETDSVSEWGAWAHPGSEGP